MSGTCLNKKGRQYSCSQCERSGLKANFDYCPFCGEEIVMRWDYNRDCRLDEQSEENNS